MRWVNDFYDDMAWLALASGRLADPARRDRPHGPAPTPPARRAATSPAQLRSAHTDDLGGGLFWSRDRDFKNSPATGPAALHLARLGETDEARRLVDWLYARLWSPESGLVLDGIRLRGGEEVLVPDVWSYNQGTVLGALVTLGDSESLTRAAALVAAVDARLTIEVDGARVLRTHGGGDGGLFTGILVRYLALAATAGPGLDARGARDAGRLVPDTAEALWRGRGEPARRGAPGPDGLPRGARRARARAAARAVAAAAGLDRPRGRRHAPLTGGAADGRPLVCRVARSRRVVRRVGGWRRPTVVGRCEVSDRARRLGAGWESGRSRVRLEGCAPPEPSSPA